jgi:hypothetical protein
MSNLLKQGAKPLTTDSIPKFKKQRPKSKRHSVVQPEDQSIRLIPLTLGLNAIVDASDYEWLMQWNWSATCNKDKEIYYATRGNTKGCFPRNIYMHRQIMREIMNGVEYPETDHENRNSLDNRRKNLRPCTHSQNQSNHSLSRRNTSGFKGVSWGKANNKWQAQTSIEGQQRHLGYFSTKEEAFAAYCEFTKAHKGEFAHLAKRRKYDE